MRFIDLFAGIGGFHRALVSLGHECVFACEADEQLRDLYVENFPHMVGKIVGDIRDKRNKSAVPDHEILCAGFPCQPFSKSGDQKGLNDRTHGTLFHEIVDIVKRRRPEFLILENVGNFERHDQGRTWEIVRETLEELGYSVRATLHKRSGGSGLLSPHHLGYPHNRERFFIAARLGQPAGDPFPPRRRAYTSMKTIIQDADEFDELDRKETQLSRQQRDCIDHWNALLKALPRGARLPYAPIWGDEFGARYPYRSEVPAKASVATLRTALGLPVLGREPGRARMLEMLPRYARASRFPNWKVHFIEENREWYEKNKGHFPAGWLERLKVFPPSLRKLEWNCHGDELDLWRCVLQFRPSGLRAKRPTASPSLVAMTTTQIPIYGPKKRSLTRIEGLRLQGFPDDQRLPPDREAAFHALGNAVHVDVVAAIASRLLGGSDSTEMQLEMDLRAVHIRRDGASRPYAHVQGTSSIDAVARQEAIEEHRNGRVEEPSVILKRANDVTAN